MCLIQIQSSGRPRPAPFPSRCLHAAVWYASQEEHEGSVVLPLEHARNATAEPTERGSSPPTQLSREVAKTCKLQGSVDRRLLSLVGSFLAYRAPPLRTDWTFGGKNLRAR
jgi:hypothetical protein